jgi:hypothetical protein
MCELALKTFSVSHEKDRKTDRSHSYSAISALSKEESAAFNVGGQSRKRDKQSAPQHPARIGTYLVCPRPGEGVIFAAVADWPVDKEHDPRSLLMALSGTFVSCQTTPCWLQQLERQTWLAESRAEPNHPRHNYMA